MLFDWFTTIAQVVNFIILLVLLKYLLYDRVLRAIDRRRSELASQREQAEEVRREAEQRAERYREQLEEIEARRDELLREARAQADKRRDEMLDEARDEVERRRDSWQRSLEGERDRLLERISSHVGRSAIEVSRRILSDLADVFIEDAIVSSFVRHIERLDDEQVEQFVEAFGESEDGVVLVSPHEIDEARRQEISTAVRERLGLRVDRFATDEGLIAGVRLSAGGRTIGWSVEDYLDELVAELSAELPGGEGQQP